MKRFPELFETWAWTTNTIVCCIRLVHVTGTLISASHILSGAWLRLHFSINHISSVAQALPNNAVPDQVCILHFARTVCIAWNGGTTAEPRPSSRLFLSSVSMPSGGCTWHKPPPLPSPPPVPTGYSMLYIKAPRGTPGSLQLCCSTSRSSMQSWGGKVILACQECRRSE